jgi:hypothetical protein
MLAFLRDAPWLRQAIIRRAIWHGDQVRPRENANKNANENGGREFRGST